MPKPTCIDPTNTLNASSSAFLPSSKKRQRSSALEQLSEQLETTSVTDYTYRLFCQTYSFNLGKDHFVSICAYLTTLLQWGLPASKRDLDRFIIGYSIYHTHLPHLHTTAAAEKKNEVPSFYSLFTCPQLADAVHPDLHTIRTRLSQSVVTEEVLGKMWKENQYRFLHLELCMEFIVDHGVKQAYVRAEQEVEEDGMYGGGRGDV